MSLLGIEKHVKSNSSYSIIDLYVQLLKSNEENLPTLKLTVADMLVFVDKLVEHFFLLFKLMNGK